MTDFSDLKMPQQEDYLVEAARNGDHNGLQMTEKRNGRHKRERLYLYVMLGLILLANFGLLYCIRRRMKRQIDQEMNSQVQNTVS